MGCRKCCKMSSVCCEYECGMRTLIMVVDSPRGKHERSFEGCE
jgi:hypothetical protein